MLLTSPQQPGMLSPLSPSSAIASSCHPSAPVTLSCVELPGASWSRAGTRCPQHPQTWARCPLLRAASGLKYSPNLTIMSMAGIQQDIYRSHFPGKGMWTWETPGCCWGGRAGLSQLPSRNPVCQQTRQQLGPGTRKTPPAPLLPLPPPWMGDGGVHPAHPARDPGWCGSPLADPWRCWICAGGAG